MKINKNLLVDITIRLLIIGILFFKAMSPAPMSKNLDKIAEIQKIVMNIKTSTNNLKDDYLTSSIKYKEDNKEVDKYFYIYAKKTSRLFHEIIIEVANRYNVDPALIKAIIMAESRFNPYAISRKGAKGLMQLMPVTAKAMGAKDPFDPEYNIDAGVRYFKKLLIMFNNDIELALAAYNAGIKKVKTYGGIPPFKSTKEYVRKVIRYYNYYKREMLQVRSNDRDA